MHHSGPSNYLNRVISVIGRERNSKRTDSEDLRIKLEEYFRGYYCIQITLRRKMGGKFSMHRNDEIILSSRRPEAIKQVMRTGDASRSLREILPRQDTNHPLPLSLSLSPPASYSGSSRPTHPRYFFGRINTFDESFRAHRQTRRRGFNLPADSNRFPAGASARFLHAHARRHANVDP